MRGSAIWDRSATRKVGSRKVNCQFSDGLSELGANEELGADKIGTGRGVRRQQRMI